MMKKKMIAAISALCMVGTVYASVGNAANAEPVQSEHTAETTASQDRIYCIASVSKMYSALAVMQLVDEGKIELDAPVTKYLPDFKMNDERYKDVTVRMLMNHTSGISLGLPTNHYLYDDVDSFVHDNTLDIVSGARFKADPGEYASYNNMGFELMEHIVENVTGMSYTDYVRNNIASKIGADHTGTAWSLYAGDTGDSQVSLYRGFLPIEYPYEMAAGTGGIYATASDVANFGSAFFTGNDVLLSDEAKTQMSTRWNDDAKYESYGLGWDFVEQVKYEKENIKVMGKGGDLPYMNSSLLVAPDEQISIAVLTAGNGSSQYAGLMASALMDVALEERGKAVSDLTPPEPEITDSIPDPYKKYEGLYCSGTFGIARICRITFDDTAMYKEDLGTDNASPERYRYTEDGGFVRVNDSGRMTADREIVYFEEKDGKIFIRTELFAVYPGLGNTADSMYTGEKMEENPVSPGAQQSWDELSQTVFVTYNEKWTSQDYETPFYWIVTDQAFPGYILAKNSRGVTKAEKMTDEHHALFFTSIPSTANRDLFDIELTEQTYADQTLAVSLDLSNGARCRSVDSLPVFTADIAEISLHSSEAAWYRIGKDMGGESIAVERPDNSAVFVYNKFRELLYSTHVKDAMNTIDLPVDGYIAFVGESGVCKIAR
ncbi:class A beta-lactamase-related serine hydrolase [bacterium 1xD42-87]|nr:class A beta-lactamase-related serine hydrolase [bacterium 1xD42-87]